MRKQPSSSSSSHLLPPPSILMMITIIILFQVSSAQNTLINPTCKTVSHHDHEVTNDFCITSLQAAPASQCATLQGLGEISIRLIYDNVTDTRCSIKQLLKKKLRGDPFTRRYVEDCFDLYSLAVDSAKEAAKSFNGKHFVDANIQISSILDTAVSCEEGFKERAGLVSPLTKRNEDISHLSSLALALIRMIQP